MDLHVVDPDKYQPGLYHMNSIVHEKVLKSSSSYVVYCTTVFQDFFKDSVTLFCTCAGSGKGKAADGQPRASLPKEALSVFLGRFQNT
jgi:hypothetical protein